MTKEIEIGRFQARSDSGKQYTIIEYQQYISAAGFDDPHAQVAGLKRFCTSTRRAVTYIDSKTFKINKTNEIVRKI